MMTIIAPKVASTTKPGTLSRSLMNMLARTQHGPRFFQVSNELEEDQA
jgi:hypothetical protein